MATISATWKRSLQLLSGALIALASTGVRAEGYPIPGKPIMLISPYSAGGDADIAARNFASAAQRALGVPVVVLNKPGASGVIGSAHALASQPDGYTLLLARPGSQSILPAIMPTRTKYKWDDFTMVGLLELNPQGCMTRPDQYKNFTEFVAALRSKGKSMNFGTAGVLTTNDMGPRQLFRLLKLDNNSVPTQIPYKGTGEATLALVSGGIDFACGSIGTFLPQIKAGKLRAIMVMSPERVRDLPDTPTVRELGYPDLEGMTGWSGIYGPPKMPPEIVARLHKMIRSLPDDPAWVRGTGLSGSIPYTRTLEETREFARNQYQMYRVLGESLNIIDKGD